MSHYTCRQAGSESNYINNDETDVDHVVAIGTITVKLQLVKIGNKVKPWSGKPIPPVGTIPEALLKGQAKSHQLRYIHCDRCKLEVRPY